jgi:hypothetical protein
MKRTISVIAAFKDKYEQGTDTNANLLTLKEISDYEQQRIYGSQRLFTREGGKY